MIGLNDGIAVIIQCRLKSKRLPNKALLELNGKPIVSHVMQTMRNVQADYFILACDAESRKKLEPLAKDENYICIDGSEEDVLSRFCKVINFFNKEEKQIKVIVRATADNPFLFVSAANASLRRYFELGEPDYFTFTGLPIGCGVEILKADSLLLSEKLTKDIYDREHVAPALYRHTDKFKCIRETSPVEWYYPDLRTTIDTSEDYLRAKYIMKYLVYKNKTNQPSPLDIINASDYAERLIVFYPSVKQGQGTGHLRRITEVVYALLKDLRCVIYIPEKRENNFFDSILEKIPKEIIIDKLPEYASLIVLDNFRTSEEDIYRLKKIAPVVAIDDGGTGRYLADYILDILPYLKIDRNNKEQFANIADAAFIPLPIKRKVLIGQSKKTSMKKIILKPEQTKTLVVCGGENAARMSLPCAKNIAALGFNVSVIDTNLTFEDIKNCVGNIKTFANIENLRERLHEWDLIITHYGFTAFEALAAGCHVILISPTDYHYKLGLLTGFTTIEPGIPSIADFAYVLSHGIKIPKIINRNSESKNLSKFIKKLSYAKKYNCPMCGSNSSGYVAVRVPDKTISHCPFCGMYYLSFVTNEPRQYTKNYFFDEYKAQYGKTYLEDFEYIRKLGLERMKNINSIYDKVFQKKQKLNIFTTEKKLLDIGCAYGPFLSAAKTNAWQPVGTDICPQAVEYVQNTLKLPAFASSFPSLPSSFDYIFKKQVTGSGYEKIKIPLEENSFSAVTMWFVIEHFQDLNSVLQKVSQLLIPGGIFAFSTPTLSGISARSSLYNFCAKSPADHYSLWDMRNAKKQLEKYGFKVYKIISTGHHPERFNLPFNIKKDSLLWKLLMKISKVFKLGDSMEIYAMKRGTISDLK